MSEPAWLITPPNLLQCAGCYALLNLKTVELGLCLEILDKREALWKLAQGEGGVPIGKCPNDLVPGLGWVGEQGDELDEGCPRSV
jgi:hypothetical protein